jgi:hypothetical protein
VPVTPTSLPFQEAIDFFRGKLNLPTETWTDLWQSQHDWGFVVAGASKAALVADFHAAVLKVIGQGVTLESFRKDFDRIVATHGWDYKGGRDWRSRIIYGTNLRTAYQAGRWKQLQESGLPYWIYRHSHAVVRPRPQHLAWDGLVLRKDDPWWKTHYPPNGWGCMCSVTAVSQAGLEKMGKAGPDTAPPIEMKEWTVGKTGPTPRTVWVPEGIDPGFGYAPGATANGHAIENFLDQISSLPPHVASGAMADIFHLKTPLGALTEAFGQWAKEIIETKITRGDVFPVGGLSLKTLKGLDDLGINPATYEIVARDTDILHALRDKKTTLWKSTGYRGGISAADLLALPEKLAYPKAVLWDTQDPALLYVFDPAMGGDTAAKIVVRVDFSLKTANGTITTNSFRTAGLVGTINLRGPNFVVLEGGL